MNRYLPCFVMASAIMSPLTGLCAEQNAGSAEDGEWLMPGKDHAGTRFSGLNQINTRNAKLLQVAWEFSTGVLNGHEAAPLVVKDVMYVVTPYPNVLYALDLRKQGAIKWAYKPRPEAAAKGVACCDVVNRGGVYADGKIVFNTLDNRTVAVDADSGKEVWKTRLGEINRGETMTMAPLVVKDKVLVGNSGGEMGVRGWVTALSLQTGKVLWRAYSTGPDHDVLIGQDFKSPYAKGHDLGATTWPSESAWRIGGGTVWGWLTYDPEANLFYYGTSNAGPWNAEQRPGDNKWTSSVFARNPDDGSAQWAYQWNPHDLYDYDGINENILLNLTIDGRERKVFVHPDRNGYMYVLDRLSGEIISAQPFVPTNAVKRVDLKTGLPEMAPEKAPKVGRVVSDICPAPPGGKDWQPIAYSPRTGLVYVPHNNLCFDIKTVETGYIAGTPYVGAEVAMKAGPGGNRGGFMAWDPVRAKKVWNIEEPFPAWSGAVVTAGDVAFYGTMDRWFKCVNARTGEELWKFRVGSGIIGQPITYKGPDGQQYVAILSGVGGWSGAVVSGQLDTRVPYGALGFVGAMQDLPQNTTAGGTLHVFSLPKLAAK